MMRQIADPRAPFQSIDEALEIGKEHLRQLGWSPVALIAEYQKGGYFVRIAGTSQQPKGGRSARNRRRQEVAEVGRIVR